MIEHVYYLAIVNFLKRVQLSIVTFVVTTLVTLNSLFRRIRMSHENGILLRGKVRIVDDPQFPSHDFFQPGREFDCRLRHAAASFLDDAKLVVRSASIKFADERIKSPFDVLMNSGEVPLFWDARTFVGFMKVSMRGRGKRYVPYLKKHPQAALGGGDSVRRNPTSPNKMIYNSKTTFGFTSTDDERFYVRYRLRPVPTPDPESGLPGKDDHAWLQNPLPDESRDRNYLKKATVEALAEAPFEYMLQIQLRPLPPDEFYRPEWISATVPWNERRFPFYDLAHVTIDEALDFKENQWTYFDMGHHPDSLWIPKARSIDDPHSLNHLRVASIWARRIRLVSYRLFGMTKEFPDTRDAKDWEGIPPMADPPPP